LRVLSFKRFIGWVLNASSLFGTPTSTATPHPCKETYSRQILEERIIVKITELLEKKLKGNYIMNTFECRNHGIDTSSTLDTSVNSTISHFSKHLKK
jgi:hypothetical protein